MISVVTKLSSYKHHHKQTIVINRSTYCTSIFDLAPFFFPTVLSSCIAFLPLPCPDSLLWPLLRVESSSFGVEELLGELNSISTSNGSMPSVPLESYDSSTSSMLDSSCSKEYCSMSEDRHLHSLVLLTISPLTLQYKTNIILQSVHFATSTINKFCYFHGNEISLI